MLFRRGLPNTRNRKNSKSEFLSSKQIQMPKVKNSKQYEVEKIK